MGPLSLSTRRSIYTHPTYLLLHSQFNYICNPYVPCTTPDLLQSTGQPQHRSSRIQTCGDRQRQRLFASQTPKRSITFSILHCHCLARRDSSGNCSSSSTIPILPSVPILSNAPFPIARSPAAPSAPGSGTMDRPSGSQHGPASGLFSSNYPMIGSIYGRI